MVLLSMTTTLIVSGAGDTIAHLACQEGNIEKLQWCSQNFPSILQVRNKIGKVPLHDAAIFGRLECVQFLLDSKVDVNPLKRGGWTPLMLACAKNNLNVIRTLIRYGSQVKLLNKDGWNCLHIAVREGNLDIIEYLLTVDSNLLKNKSKNGRTPLHTAAMYGHLEVLKLLLSQLDIQPNERDNCGITPFMDAIKTGHIPIASLLLSTQKINVTDEDYIGGRQAIHLASETGSCEGIKYLVGECGASVNCLSSIFHETPLHLAAKEGQSEAVKLLLELDTDRMLTDSKQRTALQIAVLNQRTECAELLTTE